MLSDQSARRAVGTFIVGCGWFALMHIACGAGDIPDSGRLSRYPVEPVAQSLELRLNPADEGFSGRTTVDLTVHAATRTVRLHARALELGRIALTPRAEGDAFAIEVERGELGALTITSARALAPGAYRLQIEFAGKYRHDGEAIYKTEVAGAPYLFTQFESRSARLAFPCWDEPEFKHPWQVTVRVPEGLAAFSNTEAVIASVDQGWRTLEFARTPPMPTYLVALAVGPLETVPVPGLAVPGRIITVRGQTGLAGTVVRETPRILSTIEDYFGIPYPYGKLDQVAVPEFTFGGMENVGLITYRDEIILRAPEDTDEANHRFLVQIVAHEVAHHWFGNLVTMEWWNDLWLNESFATWMEGKVLNLAYPELRYATNAIGGKQRAMRIDALPSTQPMRRDLTATDDPEQFVDALSYEKGESVLTMIEAWIGPEAFRAAMKHYFEKHRWGSTRSEDLWAAFAAASGDDVPAVASSFVEQAGVPHVALEVLPGDRVRLRQKRYVGLGGSLSGPAAATRWQMPLQIKFADGAGARTTTVLLREAEQTIDVPGISAAAWVFPNSGEKGYYRWQLGPDAQAALVREAARVLEPVERLGVLFNATALHEAGELAPGLYLSLLTQFVRDPAADVAREALDELLAIRRTYLADTDEAAFARFLRAELRPVLDRIGLQPRAEEGAEIPALRRGLIGALGVRGNDLEVIAQCRAWSAQVLRDPRSVDAGLASVALAVAAWHGDAALFDTVAAAFRAAVVPTDRAMLLETLGEFRDPALLERALKLALGADLRSHERLEIPFAAAYGSQAHREHVVLWMLANFDAIRAGTSEHAISELIRLAEGQDAALFARAREFLSAPGRVSDAGAKTIAEATDRDRHRQALRARYGAAVRAIFDGVRDRQP